MASITILEPALLKRKIVIEELFKPVVAGKTVTSFNRITSDAIFLGLGWDNFGNSLRNARHPSRAEGIFLNYFEVWKSEGKRVFSLDKAYLHLDKIVAGENDDEEILAMHCDPAISEADPAFLYKSGPHFHFQGLKAHGLAKSHIALCLGNREKVCADYSIFCETMKILVPLINAEFLERLAV